VEIVRRWLEAPKGTRQEVRVSAAEFWDVDGEYCPVRKFPEARPCHGLEEISEFVAEILEAWSDFAFAVQQMVEVDDDRVLACTTMRASGRGSEMRVEGDLYMCVWLREGRLVRVEDHLTLRGALHALGLEGDTLEDAGLAGGIQCDWTCE
jgi:SnoaL-like domain